MSSSRQPLLGILIRLAAVSYSLWLLAPWLGSTLPAKTTFVSELYALGQPYSWLFRLGDTVCGVLLLVTMWLWRPSGGPSWRGLSWEQVLRVGVAVLGLSTILDSNLPLACTPTVDHLCARAEAELTVPWYHQMHSVTSTLAALALIVAAVAAAFAFRRWLWWAFAVAIAVALAWVTWEVAGITFPWWLGTGTLGWSQRTQVLLAVAWLLCLPSATSRKSA